MGSLSGLLHRPLSAAAAVAVAAASSDLPDRFGYSEHLSTEKQSDAPLVETYSEPQSRWWWPSRDTIFGNPDSSVRFSQPETHGPTRNPGLSLTPAHLLDGSLAPPSTSVPALRILFENAGLAKPDEASSDIAFSVPSSDDGDAFYRWHLPDPRSRGLSGGSDCGMAKSQTVVVLLGWLGAKQRHLKRYVDWYTSRGYHVITFTFPMAEVLRYRVGGKAEESVEFLADHLAGWVEEEKGKNLVFHTFSNTGWLTYGAILENFRSKEDPHLMEKIKGCIVDSAPVSAPDPHVWASGFSAAILKKRSIATKGLHETDISEKEPKVTASEVALLGLLEKIFEVVLNLPSVSRRLSDVLDLLSTEQPRCPQLYIYSSSDRVIPVKAVESFVEKQRRAGHDVRACDFVSSPHVDHFRNDPRLYSSQLTAFLNNHVLTCCKCSSPS